MGSRTTSHFPLSAYTDLGAYWCQTPFLHLWNTNLDLMKSALLAAASLCVALGVSVEPLLAQDTTRTSNGTLRVFLDCSRRCDRDHFRREVPFVNYVRDRRVADVHVLITLQRSGAGTEYTFAFIGLQEFAGRADTLRFIASSTNTSDETRDAQTRTLALGLIPFVAATPVAQRLRILYAPPEEERRSGLVGQEEDPWNFWVFRIGINGGAGGESQERSFSIRGSLSADRITEKLKIEFDGRGNASRRTIDIDEDSSIIDDRRDYEFEGRIVRSLGLEHWAAGLEGSVSASTFTNQDFALRVAVGIEYSLFPFSESTRRQLTIMYSIGVSRFNFEEPTIFGVTEDTRANHRLNVSYEVRQPWGSTNLTVDAQNFLDDFALHRVRVSGRLRFRVARGFDLNASGSFTRIKDQIFLQGGDLTEEEILLQRRQRETNFEYRMSFGFSYTFGSIFSNVVNPRRGV